ncbi:MAG: tetratricopeptide repeat protein, partial [Candidatus Riflebacteria bacterium]|nr:tetratricopeptide repeat protein [Candidatus Riflebacteria bacterium]
MSATELSAEILRTEETRYLLKSPGFVALLSSLVMGLGQLFNGQAKKAATFFLAQAGVFLYVWDFFGHRIVADTLLELIPPFAYHVFLGSLCVGGIALWVYNIRDAYRTAEFLDFIFERTEPVLDPDEQEFIQSSLSVTRLGVSVHRGVGRKAVFVGAAVLLYSAGLFLLGVQFSATSKELRLRSQLKADPRDHTARFALGELLLARGEPRAARRELEEAYRQAHKRGDRQATYQVCTVLARALSLLGQTARANEVLKRALELQGAPSSDRSAITSLPATAASTGSAPAQEAVSRAVTVQASEARESQPRPAGPFRAAPVAAEAAPAPAASPAATSARAVATEATDQEETADEPSAAPVIAGEPADLFSRALSNYKVRNYGETRRLLDAYALKGTRGADYWALSGRLHASLGEWDRAAEQLTRAQESGYRGEDLDLLLAESKVRINQPDQAARHLQAHLERTPHDPVAVVMLAEIERKAGQRARALRLVEEALVESPDQPRLLAEAFRLNVEIPNEEAAYQTALKILKGPRKDVELVRSLVTQALDASRPALARRIASACIQRNPSEPLGYILAGAVLAREDNARQAMQYFEKASGLGSKEPGLFYEIATLYRKLGKTQGAIESLEKAVELGPGSATYARELGSLLVDAGRFDDARVAYQKALRVSPQDSRAQLGL